MDFPIKNGDFPVRYVKLPEGINNDNKDNSSIYSSNGKSNSKNNHLGQKTCKIIGCQWIFRLTSSAKTAT